MMLVKSSISIEAHFLSLHISLFLSQTFFQINLAISLSLSISKQLRMSFQGTLVSTTWGFVALGSYLTYCILKYIKEKPPGAQTLLDGIHRQMFWIWVVENRMVLLCDTIIIWGFKSEITAWIFGYGTLFVVAVSAIHLMICVVTRIVLVFFQDVIEMIPEDLILIGTM